jgi:hypothetical protein
MINRDIVNHTEPIQACETSDNIDNEEEIECITLPPRKGDDNLCRHADARKTWKESLRPLWRRLSSMSRSKRSRSR